MSAKLLPALREVRSAPAPTMVSKRVQIPKPKEARRRVNESRSGAVTGATIALLLERHGPQAPGYIAHVLGMDDGYVRRVCQTLAEAGILRVSAGKKQTSRLYATPEKIEP